MMTNLRQTVALGLMALTAFFSGAVSAFTYNGLSYSDSVESGRWTCSYAQAKELAKAKNIPMVVVWANPGCGYCKTFESTVGGNAAVKSWAAKRGYVMVFALGRATDVALGMTSSDVNAAFSFAQPGLSKYPFVGVWWPKGASGKEVRQRFTGRKGLMPSTSGSLAQQFMDSVDSLVSGYSVRQAMVFASPASAGIVSGAGFYSRGETVKVKATPKNGAIFTGWYAGSTLVSSSASYIFQIAETSVSLTAKFITKAEDLASVALEVDARKMASTRVVTNSLVCGVSMSWPVSASALTAVKMTASGLPSGLKLVQDKLAGTYSIAGVPKTASRIQSKTGLPKPTVAKLTVTTAGKNRVVYPLAFVIDPLPAWAVGTFNGGGEDGQLTMTISAAGKASGKYYTGARTWTLTGTAYDTFSVTAEKGTLTILAKCGKEQKTHVITVMRREDATGSGSVSCSAFTGVQNLWKTAEGKSLAKTLVRAPQVDVIAQDAQGRDGTLSLKFASYGKVTVKGRFAIPDVRTGKLRTLTLSGSADLCAVGEEDYLLYIHLPPKSSGFAGLERCMGLRWTGDGMQVTAW